MTTLIGPTPGSWVCRKFERAAALITKTAGIRVAAQCLLAESAAQPLAIIVLPLPFDQARIRAVCVTYALVALTVKSF